MSAAVAAARAGIQAALGANVPETKRPLYRTLPPSPRFPLDALGTLRPAAEALHLAVQCPPSMSAQAALAAATLAITPHHDVVLPSGTRPLTAIFSTVAESGERKSLSIGWRCGRSTPPRNDGPRKRWPGARHMLPRSTPMRRPWQR